MFQILIIQKIVLLLNSQYQQLLKLLLMLNSEILHLQLQEQVEQQLLLETHSISHSIHEDELVHL